MSPSTASKQRTIRIVLVGTTAAGLSNLYPTPIDTRLPGVEVHAHIIAGILDQAIKSRPAFMQGWELIQVVFAGLLVILFFPRQQAGAMTATLLVAVSLLVAVNLYQWLRLGIDGRLAPVLMLLLAAYVAQLGLGFFFEAKRQKRLRTLFGQYVPPPLVREMSRSDEEFTIGGESRELTVLFCDVRDFTAISESLPPDQLCALINEILTLVTREIHEVKGTIDKYMGDAVMAFWGAPLNDPHHAAHGVGAALAIVEALKRLNEGLRHRGMGPMRMGVGVNSGVMNVGNMGSEFRMAYTVMGEGVNLASRLEGLTKDYGVDVIVGGHTRRLAPGYLYRELDRVRVRGQRKAVSIYEPICPRGEADEGMLHELALFHEALLAYRQRRWDEAERLFERLPLPAGRERLAALYLRRIARFRASPPPESWDSVFAYESKP